jgi:murein tripeptide amidase MpaA
MIKTKFLLIVPIIFLACKSSSEFTGFSYDPAGVTNTTDKKIYPQKKRVIGAGEPKIWVSNEFEGARLNDFYYSGNKTYEVTINPENAPINNSPWYAFKIWSDSTHAIRLKLNYPEGRHRYLPKIERTQSGMSIKHTIQNAVYDSTDGTVLFNLMVTPEPQTVSAHFLDRILFSDFTQELDRLPAYVSTDTVGLSTQHRPILRHIVQDQQELPKKGTLILLSRQHPPEVSGYLTYQTFFRELLSDSELAQNFRAHFEIQSFPIVNPDGVVNGHWRHNASGIDLNRDWTSFNQPETQAIRDALLPLKERNHAPVVYGIDFHSTNENIFYPILQEVETTPDDITQQWAEEVKRLLPEYNFRSEEFDTSSPISKNWIYHTFNADAVTFEVDDELSRSEIDLLGKTAAQTLMELLLRTYTEL